MDDSGYYRFPTLHDDTVVFACEDDLWAVGATGGQARRLTSGVGQASRPRFSPDGKKLAFTATEEGDFDVYVMPSEGGVPQRISWIGEMAFVQAWSPTGDEVMVATCFERPFMKTLWMQAIPAQGGSPRALNLGPARGIAYGAKGQVALCRHQEDPARWKRYKGGTCGAIWIDKNGEGAFTRLPVEGNLASPMWIGDRLFFQSDHEGVGNLYSCLNDGSDLKRHTHSDAFYVRHPSTDGNRIVYHCGADLFIYDPKSDKTRRIDIQLGSPKTQTRRHFLSAQDTLESYALDPTGASLGLTIRGQTVCMGCWDGPSTLIGAKAGRRFRSPQFTADGQGIISIVDDANAPKGAPKDTGREVFVIHDRSGNETKRFQKLKIGRPLEYTLSPDGEYLAYANVAQQVAIIDLKRSKQRILEHSPHGRPADLSWSADSKWLAYAFPETQTTSAIRIANATTGETIPITDGTYPDFAPSFDPTGKYLFFLSRRNLDPVYDDLYFDLNFPKTTRAFLVTLQSDVRSPFLPDPKPLVPEKAAKKTDEANPSDEATETQSPPQIELKDIHQRVVRVPISPGRYTQLIALEKKILLLDEPIKGSLNRNWRSAGAPAAGHSIVRFDLESREVETLVRKVSDFVVDARRKTLAYRSGAKLRVIKAGEKPPKADPTKGSPTKPCARTGWVNLTRARVEVVPTDEWLQMYRESWRLMRDHFWTEDLSGVDWSKEYKRYRPLVDRVACRGEFSDLMWEIQGELGTSHAYEIGGDYRSPPSYRIGRLGASFVWDQKADAYRIERLVTGEPGAVGRQTPLTVPGVNVQNGDLLRAINGRPLHAGTPPQAQLVHHAGQQVHLTVADADGQNERTVVVQSIGNDRGARYREWVLSNRDFVHQATGGRCGYVHVPDMGPGGYADFHRDYLTESSHEALIVDVRFNGGGHVSQLLLEKLARKRLGFSVSRYGSPQAYPRHSIGGPIVALTNERAGSDGDIFSHCFKGLGLGTLIGMRTWGGVIGIWPRYALVDGTVTTQPEFSFWFKDVGWNVENYGTDPDLEVDISPQDHLAGRDPQMDAAIASILGALESRGPEPQPIDARPNLARPTLPKA